MGLISIYFILCFVVSSVLASYYWLQKNDLSKSKKWLFISCSIVGNLLIMGFLSSSIMFSVFSGFYNPEVISDITFYSITAIIVFLGLAFVGNWARLIYKQSQRQMTHTQN